MTLHFATWIRNILLNKINATDGESPSCARPLNQCYIVQNKRYINSPMQAARGTQQIMQGLTYLMTSAPKNPGQEEGR